ncbi:hypothetical protein Tco_0216846 [Tanacetum coccineum]
MSTDKESSAAGTDNRPPMLVESDYESWRIRIERYIRGKPLGKLIWRSIQNGPTPHPQITVTEGQGEVAVQVRADTQDKDWISVMKITHLDIPSHRNEHKYVIAFLRIGQKCMTGTDYYCDQTIQRESVVMFRIKVIENTELGADDGQNVGKKDKMLVVNEVKEKATVFVAEADAFLAGIVEYVDEGPNAAAAFMANLSSTSGTNGATTSQVNEVHTDANQIFDNVNHLLTHEMHQEEHLDSDVESDIDDNTIPYHQYQLDSEVQDVPTEVSSAPPGEISMITILDDLRTQLDGHLKVNQEQCLVNDSLRAELAKCKLEIVRLDTQQVKLDLERQVRQEQNLVTQRNARNAELEQEKVMLKTHLKSKDVSIEFLKSENQKVLTDKKKLEDKYLDEIVCLKSANKVATDLLQKFQMPTHTIPMLSKKPKNASQDLHKDILGRSNPRYGKKAPVINASNVWDTDETLASAEVSMAKMKGKPGHVRPESGFYEKLNALKFVPQQELSREQVYWLPANEIASQASTPATPVTPYVPKSPPPSQVLATLHNIKAVFPQFDAIIKERTTVKPLYVSLPCYEYAKEFALQQVVPFLDYFKKHVQTADDTIVKEVAEFKEIHYALEDEYERCVLENKNLIIEKKNLLIKNDSLIAECLERDICSIVLYSDVAVTTSSNYLCKELRSNCDGEHSKVVELEAEILKKQQMLNESEKCCAFIEKNHVNLQVKFQKYKECLQNQRVCDNSNSTASNAIFEINKLKDQLQGKDDTIRNLQTQINITRMLNVGSTVGSFDKQALETERTQLKDALTSVRIQIDGYKAENINALTAENAKLKTELSGKKSSGSTASEKPKVLASGMYTNSSKYVPPPKRANWVKPTPLPKKKQVTFQEPPRTSNRPTQKPPVQQNKKPNVSVNLSTRTRPATESRKPMPKSHTRNHRILPSKSVNARRAADHNRKLNFVDHNQFVIRSLKSVNTKTPKAKHNMKTTKKVWKAKVVASVKPQWKPTGRHFTLYDICPLTRIMEPIVEPLELTPSVSSSSKVTMISRFTNCKLSDRKADSKGISGIFEC